MANRWGNNGNSDTFIFLGSKITADGNCSHEVKRRLLLGRKSMTNLDSVLKSRDIILRIPWTARRFNQSVINKINAEYSLEGLMLKLKLQHFGHLMRRTDSLEKTLMLEKTEAEAEAPIIWPHDAKS